MEETEQKKDISLLDIKAAADEESGKVTALTVQGVEFKVGSTYPYHEFDMEDDEDGTPGNQATYEIESFKKQDEHWMVSGIMRFGYDDSLFMTMSILRLFVYR
jgi:hypothetical protein